MLRIQAMRTFAVRHLTRGLGGDVRHLFDGVAPAAGADGIVVAQQLGRRCLRVIDRLRKGCAYNSPTRTHGLMSTRWFCQSSAAAGQPTCTVFTTCSLNSAANTGIMWLPLLYQLCELLVVCECSAASDLLQTRSHVYDIQHALGPLDQSWHALDPTYSSNLGVALQTPRTLSGAACTRSKLYHVMAPKGIFVAYRCRRSTFQEVLGRDEARVAAASCSILLPHLVITQVCTGDRSPH